VGLLAPTPFYIADAIMDRLIHRSHRLELHGESLRKTYTKTEGLRDE